MSDKIFIFVLIFGLLSCKSDKEGAFSPAPPNPPHTPVLLSPDNHATLVCGLIGFDWQSVDQATAYIFQLGNVMVSSHPETEDTVSESNYYSGDSLFAGYYEWRVKAGDGADLWSDWSETFYFKVVQEQSL